MEGPGCPGTPLRTLTAPPGVSPADRLGATAFFAVIAHLIVILGVTFTPEDRPERRSEPRIDALDVVLVPFRSETAPDRPDHLAQANWDGGGERTGKARPRAPEPAPSGAGEAAAAVTLSSPSAGSRLAEPATSPGLPASSAPALPETPPASPPAPSPEGSPAPAPASIPDAVTAASGIETVSTGPARPPVDSRREREPIGSRPAGQSARPESARAEEASRADDAAPAPATVTEAPAPGIDTPEGRRLATAALGAEIERKLRTYAERPRRKWISARTREHRFAAYMHAWRTRVERIGNLHYPDEAARRGLSGNLLLDVALHSDGTIESVTVRRSSGERILDDAAVRIVQLAAPFPAFPKDVAEEVDVLHITRTWIFHSDNRFGSR